jgi:CopG family nickel-responsive transcriptional regulator
MQRVTISMSEELAAELEAFMAANGYDNRSEALRDLARLGLGQAKTEGTSDGACVATLAYVFNHRQRDIPKRLAEAYHDRHNLTVATMQVMLDHDHCLEVAVLRGNSLAVKSFAQTVIAERGVQHGRAAFIPVEIEVEAHLHAADASPHAHLHAHPKG